MGGLSCKHLFWGSFVESNEAPLTVLIFLLIPRCLTVDVRAAPIIPNETFLWAWNVPSDNCIGNFKNSLDMSLFSLIGSPRKTLVGQGVTIFYADRLGLYPYVNDKNVEVNGGLPQAASLENHLNKARTDILYYLPVDKVGLTVIDWEEWRPTWGRNWSPKDFYKSKSIDLIKSQNQGISNSAAITRAKEAFEQAGKNFMLETLKLGKAIRPKSFWGYYLFPDCYNNRYNEPNFEGVCPDLEKQRNDNLSWLWKESTSLFPSVYLKRDLKLTPQAKLYARYRILEAIRVSKVRGTNDPVPVFLYTRIVFSDQTWEFLTKDDLVNTIGEAAALGISGLVIWDTTSLAQRAGGATGCPSLHKYMRTTLNPYIINVTLATKMCSQALCQDKGVCARKNSNSNVYLHLNPNYIEIRPMKNGKFELFGNPRVGDLQYFSEHFKCVCFANKKCKTNDVQSVENVHVCTGENICLTAAVEPNPAFCLSPGKSLLFLTALTHILHHLPQALYAFLGKMLMVPLSSLYPQHLK